MKSSIPIWQNISLNNLKGEVWNAIPKYEGIYEVSDMGRVKSLPKRVQLFNGCYYFTKEKILKQRLSGSKEYPDRKYLFVALFNAGTREDIQVHRLVGNRFVDNPYGHNVINHLKGITTDNRATELEWTTYGGNLKHAYDMGLNKGPMRGRFGLNHPSARKVQCLLTGRIMSLKDAAGWLEVSKTALYDMLKGRYFNWSNFINYGS
jgi:hypothetical protein